MDSFKNNTKKINEIQKHACQIFGIGQLQCTSKGEILYIDSVTLDIFELQHQYPNPDTLIGKNIQTLITHVEHYSLFLSQLQSKQKAEKREWRFITHNNKEKWVMHHSYLIEQKENTSIIQCIMQDITHLKEMEIAFKKSEEKYRKLMDSANAAIIVADVESGQIVDVNKGTQELLGYTRDEIIGMHQSKLHPENEQEKYIEIFKRHVYHQTASNERVDVCHKNGKVIPAEINSSVIEINGKKWNQGIFSDISHRIKTEEELKKSEIMYRSLFEYATDAIFVESMDGTILSLNEKAADMLGYKKEELINQPVELLLPEKFTQNKEELIEKLKSHQHFRMETKNKRKDGVYIDVEVSLSLVQLTDQSVFQVFVRDITERKKEQMALRESEERYRQIIEATPIAFVIHKMSKVTYMNPYALNTLGAESKNQVIGKSILNFIHPDDQEITRERIKKILQGEEVPLFERKVVRFDGSILHMEFITKPLAYGEEKTALTIGRDVTESKLLYEKMRYREQRLERENQTLLELTKNPTLYSGNLVESFQVINEIAASAFATDRASIWLYDDTGNYLECIDQYDKVSNEHSKGEKINVKKHSAYFQTLDEVRTISSENVRLEALPEKFIDSYLKNQRITSLINAPVRYEGNTVGVLFLENINSTREWETDELNFAGSVADLISIVLDAEKRKVAEDSLRESEEIYRMLVENMNDGLIIVNEEIQLLYVNDRFCNMLSYKNNEVLERSLLDFMDEENQSILKHQMEERKTGRKEAYEIEWIKKDKKRISTIVSPQPLFDNQDQFKGSIAVITDITERKQAEEQLKKSEAQYRNTIDSMADLITVINRELKIILYNETVVHWCIDLGLSNEILNKPVFKVFPFLPNSVKSEYERVFKEGKLLITEETNRIGGRTIITETRKIPIYDGAKVSQIVTIIRDITHRKKAEEALRDSEERFRTLVNSIEDIVYTLDQNQRYIGVFGKWLDKYNQSAQNYLGKTIQEVFGEDKATIHQEANNIALSGNNIVYEWEGEFNTSTKYFQTSLSPLRYPDGGIRGIVAVGRDITNIKKVQKNLKEALQRAEDADRLKSAFLANMSHEIRTPLTAILGYVDVMALNPDLKQEHKRFLNIIKKNGNLLLSLINDILELSKIEANQEKIELKPVSLETIFDNIRYNAKILNTSGEKNLEIRSQIPSDISRTIICDSNKIIQVLNNLVGNAIKFTHEGSIEFGVRQKDDTILVFYVTDTGIGIPEDKLDLIFEPFAQVDVSDTRKYGGTGLGLTITKKLVELMGGEVIVESNPEQGSTFSFTHPYIPSKAVEKKEEFKSVLKSSTRDHTILLCEDNVDNQELIKTILLQFGYQVVTSDDGKQSLEKYLENYKQIDLILMDIQMPQIDGIEVIKRIRSIEKSENRDNLPIIALTGKIMKEDKEHCYEAGCNDFLTKPIDIDLLISTLGRYL